MLNGDHWREWLSHRCPTLVIQGAKSRVVPVGALAEMARRRANTKLVSVEARSFSGAVRQQQHMEL